jgi:protein TonB
LSPLNNWKRPQRNKNTLLSTLLISIGLHGVLLFPFWQFRTLKLTVPERPMRMVLNIPLAEQVQPVTPPRRQLNKVVPSPAKRAAKPIVKPVEKPVVKAPAPLPEKNVAKAAEIPASPAVNPAPPFSEKQKPAAVRMETKPVITEAEPQQAVHTEPVAAAVTAPPGEVEKPAPSVNQSSVSPAYLQKVFDKIKKGKRYPRLARDRGIEGAVLLEFVLASDGKLVDIRVLHSSGFAILDREALQTIRRAAPFPKLPEGTLAGRVALKVPISFALTN